MKQLILILALFISQSGLGQNTISESSASVHQQAFDIVTKDLSRYLKDSTIIIKGTGISNINSVDSNFRIIDTNENQIYWNEKKRKLSKKYKDLIGKNIIELHFKPIVLKSDTVQLMVIAFNIKYKTRSSYDISFVGDAAWLFSFTFDCDTKNYLLKNVDQGIEL